MTKEIAIPIDESSIKGNLTVIPESKGLVIFAHGSGSSRFSKRNQYVAKVLNSANISTLLFDLLTEEEDKADQITREYRFDIPLLSDRLSIVKKWVQEYEQSKHFSLAYFGSSTGAAAALIAAAKEPQGIKAVVSRGGRTDLANDYLAHVQAATLFIVGKQDYEILKLNEDSYLLLQCPKAFHIVPNATHLFEEPGTLEEVADVAANWFAKYL